jgi:hypothetical protein
MMCSRLLNMNEQNGTFLTGQFSRLNSDKSQNSFQNSKTFPDRGNAKMYYFSWGCNFTNQWQCGLYRLYK